MKNLFHENLAADGGARPVREALFERWRGRFWQVLARAGLADGDAAAPQAAAPRPLTNAADVLQLLEDAPILTDLRLTLPQGPKSSVAEIFSPQIKATKMAIFLIHFV